MLGFWWNTPMFEIGQRFSISLAVQYYRHLRYLLSFTLSNQPRPFLSVASGCGNADVYSQSPHLLDWAWTAASPPPDLLFKYI